LARGRPDISVTLLLGTLTGGAMMLAMVTPPDHRAAPARKSGTYAPALAGFPPTPATVR
jgi:hypothetical protein